jgi:hypothetical protein
VGDRMTIQAGWNFKDVTVPTEHVVINDSTQTHQKRIDISAVNTAGMLRP